MDYNRVNATKVLTLNSPFWGIFATAQRWVKKSVASYWFFNLDRGSRLKLRSAINRSDHLTRGALER